MSEHSTVYFILHRDEEGYTELCIDSNQDLFVRRTIEGVGVYSILLGKSTEEQIGKIQHHLDQLLIFTQETNNANIHRQGIS